MARSLSIAAYLASRGSADLPTRLLDYPARPDGVVIWGGFQQEWSDKGQWWFDVLERFAQ